MVRVIIVVRELNRDKPDFFLPFELPEVPKVGDYISIFRPNSTLHTEDVIVRHVWWHLYYPETHAITTNEPKAGRVQDIMVECDVALGPYASDNWRTWTEAAKTQGAEVVEFKASRLSFLESRPEK